VLVRDADLDLAGEERAEAERALVVGIRALRPALAVATNPDTGDRFPLRTDHSPGDEEGPRDADDDFHLRRSDRNVHLRRPRRELRLARGPDEPRARRDPQKLEGAVLFRVRLRAVLVTWFEHPRRIAGDEP
jgi:hypothetical protein